MKSENKKPIFTRSLFYILGIILLIIIIILLLRCCGKRNNGDDNPIVKVSSISAYPDSLNLKVGESKQLTVIFYPDNATNKEFNCKSNDEKVATVDNNCLVTAIDEGETTITIIASDNNIMTTVDVVVTKEDNPTEEDDDLKAPGLSFKCGSAVYKSNNWCNKDVTISIIGVPTNSEKSMCSKNGNTKCNPFTDKYNEINKDGTHTVCVGYTSNGVQSKTTCKTIVVKIDKTAPKCTYAIISNKLRATCTDSGSGIASVSADWSKAGNGIYDHSLINQEGSKIYPLTVKDNAGNQYSGSATVAVSLKVCQDGYSTYYFGERCYRRVGTTTKTWTKGSQTCCQAPDCSAFTPQNETDGLKVGYYYKCGALDQCQHESEYVGSCTKYTLSETCSVSGSFAIDGYCYYSANKINKYLYNLVSYK